MGDDPHTQAAARRLQAVLDSAAREAGAAQALIQDAMRRFNAISQEVVGVVGGSAQQVDQQMVASLEEASRSANSALAALSSAAAATRTVR